MGGSECGLSPVSARESVFGSRHFHQFKHRFHVEQSWILVQITPFNSLTPSCYRRASELGAGLGVTQFGGGLGPFVAGTAVCMPDCVHGRAFRGGSITMGSLGLEPD